MLQALKVDPGPRPQVPRDPDPAPDFLNQAFAGYLATAANLAGCPLPSGATATPAPKPAPESRGGPSGNPVPASRPEAAKPPKAEPESDPDSAPPRKAADPAEVPRPKAPTPTRSETGTKEAAAPGTPESTSPKVPATPSDPAAPAAPSGPILPWAEITASHEVTPGSHPAPVTASRAVQAPDTMPTPVDAGSREAATAAPARFHFPEGTQAANAKPALTELLAIPLPEMETPKPLQSLSRLETAPLRETQALGAMASFKAVDTVQAPPTPPPFALALAARDTAQGALAKSDAATPLKSTGPATPLAGIASGTSLRGTPPVPSAEGAQGAKAQATFTQMDGTIRWLLKNQEKGAEIQLNPESLGRVVIKIRVEGSEVHARVWASEATTVPLLQDQRAALEASLRQQGLSLGSFNLQQGQRGDDSRATAQFPSGRIGAGIAETREPKQDLPSASPSLPGGARLIELLA